ncbi:MAG: hypothetical protein O9341_23640, partial [Paucibacter sp.]|nr:hypothetical protein [Roseateles sp.]
MISEGELKRAAQWQAQEPPHEAGAAAALLLPLSALLLLLLAGDASGVDATAPPVAPVAAAA